MTQKQSESIAKLVLPEEIFNYFELKGIKEIGEDELHLYLEEQNVYPIEYVDDELESKGFYEEVTVKDFPIRDRGVWLHVRRRKWLDKTLGKAVFRDWNLVAEGTHYTKGFASFLKEIARYTPCRHPFA